MSESYIKNKGLDASSKCCKKEFKTINVLGFSCYKFKKESLCN